jgi:hypothetical protein
MVLNPETIIRVWKRTETSAYIERSSLILRVSYLASQGGGNVLKGLESAPVKA